jgi:hypothetical protein
MLAALLLLSASQVLAADTFTVTDHLGREWRNELLRFPLSRDSVKPGPDARVVDEQNAPVPFQVVEGAHLALLADVPAYGTRTWRIVPAAGVPAAPATDLVVEETTDMLRLANAHTGIELARTANDGVVIRGVKLPSGAWIGGGRLVDAKPAAFTAELRQRGPVFAEALVTATFADQSSWSLRATLHANEPVVLLAEQFTGATAGALRLDLARGYAPTHVYYRYGKSDQGRRNGYLDALPLADLAGETKFVLEPWLRWWMRTTQGNWFGLYRADQPDLLAMGAYRPSRWLDPAQPPETRAPVALELRQSGDALTLDLPLRTGERHWFLGAWPREAALQPLAGTGEARYMAPLPQLALIKHGQVPLETVRQWTLAWEQPLQFPRLFVTPAQLAAFRQRYRTPDERTLKTVLQNPPSMHFLDGLLYHYYGSGDDDLADKLINAAASNAAEALRRQLEQSDLVSWGFAPHHQTQIVGASLMADAVLADDRFDPTARRRLLAQFAALGYLTSSPDYWSPARGFAANPNMTTTVASFQAMLGALLYTHPDAPRWLDSGLAELKRQLNEWSDDNGGWLEAPHYAMVSFDVIAGYLYMAALAGRSDEFYGERLQKVALWLAKIATPPDARLLGRRHGPPIGNSYKFEPTGEFGLLAALWRERLPELSAHLQWLHQQEGSPLEPGVGGFFPTFAGYRSLLRDATLPAKAPAWGSELFPHTGAVLRAHFPSDRETMAYLILGDNHDHYDDDSGSFTFWGKGRIICDDFGYVGRQSATAHSLLDSPAAPGAARLQASHFQATPLADYVRGTKQGWQRQLLLVKDSDPLGANYLVVRDRLAQPAAAVWRLFFTAAGVQPIASGAKVTGQEDVDTDVAILVQPAGTTVTTDTQTHQTWGLDGEGKYARTASTQTALVLTWQAGTEVVAVLYPRLKDQPAPVIAARAEGGFTVTTAAGTDTLVFGTAGQGAAATVTRTRQGQTTAQAFEP